MSEKNQVKWRGVRPTHIAALTSGQKTVTDTDTEILDANNDRDYAFIKNIGSVDVYIKPAASVTTANGELLSQGEFAIFEGYAGKIHGITASGSATLYYEEG